MRYPSTDCFGEPVENWSHVLNGVYRLSWKDGGSSLVSVGCDSNGLKWFAPCNWVSVPCTDWSMVESVEDLGISERRLRDSENECAAIRESYMGMIRFTHERRVLRLQAWQGGLFGIAGGVIGGWKIHWIAGVLMSVIGGVLLGFGLFFSLQDRALKFAKRA